jgi:hypothetical protein
MRGCSKLGYGVKKKFLGLFERLICFLKRVFKSRISGCPKSGEVVSNHIRVFPIRTGSSKSG